VTFKDIFSGFAGP